MTFDEIMQAMLAKVPDTFDKRENSLIYAALAPAAMELASLYAKLEFYDQITYAQNAEGDHLTLRCAERGVIRKQPTKAIRKATLNTDVPIGTRFGVNGTTYIAQKRIEANQFELQCEQAGEIGNVYSGEILPIDYVQGLNNAQLTDILIPGEDQEDDQTLRKRYFNSIDNQAFGGNMADYLEKTNAIDGVGGTKVYPVWNGGGTVKLVVIDSSFNKPSTKLIDDIQQAIDPLATKGKGYGIAPIGHTVTVEGVGETIVTIATNITLQSGYTWEDVKPILTASINEYLSELRKTWADSQNIVVRIAYIETRALATTGVLDITNTTINGLAQNLSVDANNIPVLGEVSNP